MSSEDGRFEAILEVLMAYARQDFAPRLAVSDRRDEIDAIATGINLLAEELTGEVASRRELESAYARLQTAQTQLLLAEKLAAVGQLASGVAHELNNPAAWVLLGLDTAQRQLAHARASLGEASSSAASELAAIDATLADVHAGMDRIRAVLDDLRTLSRAEVSHAGELDLDDIVRAACQLARPAYLSVARLELELGGLPPIVGERGALGQLVTNLVINAAYAVGDGGADQEIVVTTRQDGDHVVLAVEDTGPGIPEELFERVFDPYFTTKPSGIGTGLGLALVRRIAERHGGTARATHGTRRGARIEVRLPCDRGGSRASPGTSAPPAARTTTGARARILVIDDEPMLLRAVEQAVGDQHEVVSALGGEAAREVLARDRAFDLVCCDLQMPRVDGVALHELIARSAPELLPRLVVMTGGAVTPRAAQFLDKVRPRILDKPINLDELLDLARDAAAHRPPSPAMHAAGRDPGRT